MKRPLARTAVRAAASLAMLLPLAGCSEPDRGAPSTSTEPTANSTPTDTAPASVEYQDGTYTARGIYGGAPSYMDFTVSLKTGVITNVESELMPENNDTSRRYQERFAAAVPDEVIGKNIADLEVDVIAGASGSADGFNNALAKIREQASD